MILISDIDMTLNTKVKNVCPECGSRHTIRDGKAGEIICQGCGLVIQDTILDKGPEWRAFTPEQWKARRRAGSKKSLTMYDKGLSASIFIKGDVYSGKLSSNECYKMLRLRRLNIRSKLHKSVERNLFQAMIILNKLCEKLKIPRRLHESAAMIYRKALGKGLVRGRSIAAIAAASLYIALRRANIPRTIKEISDASSRRKKEVSRCYRLVLWELGYKTPIDDPVQYVSKIASNAGISQSAQTRALQLLRKARQMRVTVGKDPSGVAAAALYIACSELDEKVTQRELAEAANVTEVTIRNRYKGLLIDMKLKLVEV
jgi:transcription initiation factor TFIIB